MAEVRRRSRSPRTNRKSRFSDVDPQKNEEDLIKSLETVKNVQTSKVDRKLYVGNLPAGISQSQLVDLLNTALINKKLNAYPGNPVLSAWISQDGHYAFVEFRSIEEATRSISLNNYPILGQNLKVGRPRTYTGSQPASATDRNTLMGGYTLPSVSAYANLTDITKQGPLKPMYVHLSSEVMILKHVLPVEILENDAKYELALNDITSLVLRFGKLIEVYAPRDGKHAGNVYLQFDSIEEAISVRRNIYNKAYLAKPIEIGFIPFTRFKERQLDDSYDLRILING